MANFPEISTLDNRPRWMEEIRDALRLRPDTQHFFAGSYRSTDLLIREPASEEESGSEQECAVINTGAPTEKTATQFRPKSMIPRARRVNTLPQERYILLKKFEGFVTSRNERSFTTRLFENVSDYPVVEAEFDLEELSETDRLLAVDGAALVWTIGYRYEGNTRKRESVIYLRRLPPWKDEEAVLARKEVDELTRDIHWK